MAPWKSERDRVAWQCARTLARTLGAKSGMELVVVAANALKSEKALKAVRERGERLPLAHKDPFDRMLIAQAQAEGLILVTHNEASLYVRRSMP